MAYSAKERILSLLAYHLPSKELRSPIVPIAEEVAAQIEANAQQQIVDEMMGIVSKGKYPKGVIGTEVKQVLSYLAGKYASNKTDRGQHGND